MLKPMNRRLLTGLAAVLALLAAAVVAIHLAVPAEALRGEIGAWLGHPIVAGNGLGALDAQSRLAVKEQHLTLIGLKATLDRVHVVGSLDADIGGAVPKVDGSTGPIGGLTGLSASDKKKSGGGGTLKTVFGFH
jgi:hypothetical protein